MKFGKKLKIVSNKEFDSELEYNEKNLKAKIYPYNGKTNTNFYNNKIPKEGSQFICLLVILIDSVFRTGKNYYPQVLQVLLSLFHGIKYLVKEKKMSEYITDDIEISSDFDREDSDEENSNEENSDEENWV